MSLSIRRHWPSIVISLLITTVLMTIGSVFFIRSRDGMEAQIRDRLKSLAATAALSIEGEAMDRIKGPADMNSIEYQETIFYLDRLRKSLPYIRYAYILRSTNDQNTLAFVADADAALTFDELDTNDNNILDLDEEAAFPGELYDISDMPALQGPAFIEPSADQDITIDQWGRLVSGYAPIYRNNGTVAAVLGIDMDAEDFENLSISSFNTSTLMLLFSEALLLAALIAVIWEKRQYQMMVRMNNERSGLLRLTFHQLGEPLTIMKWSLETLRDQHEPTELQETVKDHLVVMDEGLGRLNSIIDTLQLAEKIDLGTLEYIPSNDSLRALVDNAVEEWVSSIKKRKQRIHVLMHEDINLNMDKNMLLLVLRQLLVNAIEYSDDGTTISVIVTKQRHHVEISIQDEGCGIPKDHMEHLFEKYRRASNAHLKKPDGNGLGLYIAKGIVEKAGGTMNVESEVGKGTTVTFTLPLE